MPRSLSLAVFLAFLLPTTLLAQTGQGSLRGYVKDAQGGALPGVTVTATSPELLRPVTAVTNEEGYYRLLNLPPGTYVITAELTGFSTFKREGILLRAGANFQVDVEMSLGALQETITVAGESPMIEVSKPSNVLNIDGEFQRQMPIQARRNWSDFLELTPGVISRGFDDGSGRQVYFGHGTEHFAHVIQLEGMIASNYHDAQVTYVGMGSDMVQDIQVKTGGYQAEFGQSMGGVVNVITGSAPEVGEALVTSKNVDMISFTGSTNVGVKIYEAGAATMKRLLLELGGKGACIVCEDADLTKAIAGLVSVWGFHSGQICTAPTRAIVHRKVYDHLVGGLQAAAPNLKIGPPESEDTIIGPVISGAHRGPVRGDDPGGEARAARTLQPHRAARRAQPSEWRSHTEPGRCAPHASAGAGG